MLEEPKISIFHHWLCPFGHSLIIFLMKNISLFLLIFFLFAENQAQTISPFFTHFDIDREPDSGGAILPVGDSAYWVLGRGGKWNPEGWYTKYLSLHKITNSGHLIVDKFYGYSQGNWYFARASTCVNTFDGNLMIAGIVSVFDTISQSEKYHIKMIKFDINGDSLWSKSFDWGRIVNVFSMIQTPDSGFIITGNYYTIGDNDTKSDMYVLKTNAIGEQEWLYEAGYANQSDGASSVILSPHGYLIGGYGFNRSSASVDGMVILLNPHGQKITEWFYSEREQASDCGTILFPIQNSTDFFMSHCHPDTSIEGSREFIVFSLSRVAISGQVIWKRWLAGPGFRNLWRVRELPNGDVMAAGQWTPPFPESSKHTLGWLSRFSAEGEPLWESFILPKDTSHLRIEDFYPAPDGGFYCTGMFNSLTFYGSDIAFFKTDSFGCIQPGCQIFAGVEEEIAKKKLRIYPNPASGRLYIEADKPMQNMQLQIVDVNGRRIHWEEESVFSGLKEIDVSNWKSGMYWVLWTVDGQVKRSQSIVITH